VIGLGDRALGWKARAQQRMRTDTFTPRVISPQNRMRLTRSPCRSLMQPCQSNPLNHTPQEHKEYMHKQALALIHKGLIAID